MDHHSSCGSAEIAPNQSELRWAIAELVAMLLIPMMMMIRMMMMMLIETKMWRGEGTPLYETSENSERGGNSETSKNSGAFDILFVTL